MKISEGEYVKTLAFDRFLTVARDKPQSQRLLFVFAKKQFREDGETYGGSFDVQEDFSINPFMYIDKNIDEFNDFESLLNDSTTAGKTWDFMYLSAIDENALSPSKIIERMEVMVKMIHQGVTDKFLIFDRSGEIAQLNKLVVQ